MLLELRPKLRGLILRDLQTIDLFRVQLLGRLVQLKLELLLRLDRLRGARVVDILRHADRLLLPAEAEDRIESPRREPDLIALDIDPDALEAGLEIILQGHLDGAMKGDRLRDLSLEEFLVGVLVLRLRLTLVKGRLSRSRRGRVRRGQRQDQAGRRASGRYLSAKDAKRRGEKAACALGDGSENPGDACRSAGVD